MSRQTAHRPRRAAPLRWALLVLAASALARAQPPEDFALPNFGKAPPSAPSPSSPPLPPPDALPVTRPTPIGQVPPPAGGPVLVAPRPPRQLRWSRLAGSTSGMLLALTNVYVGGEVSLLGSLGTPTRSPSSAGAVEGWLLQVGGQGSLGFVSGTVCEGAGFCGTRLAGGLALKGGWGRGVPDREGWTSPTFMLYAQLDLLAGFFAIPSAPLVAEVSSWEAVGRLRLGAHFAAVSRPSAPSRVTLNGALVIEGVPVSRAGRGVSIGALLGIAF